MTLHKCEYCNLSTIYKNVYDTHLLSIKHKKNLKNIVNIKYNCEECNFESLQKCDFNKHLLTQKHIKNSVEERERDNIIINKITNLEKHNEEVKKQNEAVIKQNEELKQKIERLEEINNQNTNKIVKEARAIKKSILTILNTNFRDTPSIDYIQEEEFKRELEQEYKCKLNDPENKLFMRIFSDYENKKLVKSLSDIILKIVKKGDQKSQSVFNIDSARGNYATKIENCWFNDKSGLQLKKYTLEMVIKYMINVLDKFRLHLVEVRNQNMKKSTREQSDFLMKYQSILLEVNAYLTNTNTHKKIILHMCPELRMDQKLLESIENEF